MPTSHQPLVSVIMSAYQAEATLGAAISSVLTQTYPRVELVIVNDGSTDATADIIKAHQSCGNIVAIQQANAGVGSARDAAMAASSGDYLAILDADDMLLPSYLATSLQCFTDAGPGKWVVVNNANFLTPTGIASKRRYLPHPNPAPADQRLKLLHANFNGITSVFPRAMYDEIGGFDRSLRHCEDWDYWLRAAFHGWVFLRQSKPLALYRWTGGSLSSEQDAMYQAEDQVLLGIYEKFQAALTPEETEYLTMRLRDGSPRQQVSLAEKALRNGDLNAAKAAFQTAQRLSPDDLRLKARATLSRVKPAAHLLAKRQRRIEHEIGFHEDMQR